MANDYIKFSRTEFEVVGGKFNMQYSTPNGLMDFMQAIFHQ